MKARTKDRTVNTAVKVGDLPAKHLPHERDEAPDAAEGQQKGPRAVIEQAASDIEQGLVDTDLRGTPGVERVRPRPPGQAKPRPGLRDKAS